MIRYRSQIIPSRFVAKLAENHIPRLGQIKSIEGKRYLDKNGIDHECVVVRGENGSAQFSGTFEEVR